MTYTIVHDISSFFFFSRKGDVTLLVVSAAYLPLCLLLIIIPISLRGITSLYLEVWTGAVTTMCIRAGLGEHVYIMIRWRTESN